MAENIIKPLSAEKIHHDIAEMLSRGSTYIESLVEYARVQNIEIETIAEIVKKSPVIKEKIKSEAQDMRLVKQDKHAAQLRY